MYAFTYVRMYVYMYVLELDDILVWKVLVLILSKKFCTEKPTYCNTSKITIYCTNTGIHVDSYVYAKPPLFHNLLILCE